MSTPGKSTLAACGNSSLLGTSGLPRAPGLPEGHHGSVSPELLERIEGAGLTGEDVNDEIGVIDEDPLAEFVPLDVARPHILLLERLHHGVADRLRLAGLLTGGDQKAIGETGDPLEAQSDRILGLLRVGGPGRDGDLALQLDDRTFPSVGLSATPRFEPETRFQISSSSSRIPFPLTPEIATNGSPAAAQ